MRCEVCEALYICGPHKFRRLFLNTFEMIEDGDGPAVAVAFYVCKRCGTVRVDAEEENDG